MNPQTELHAEYILRLMSQMVRLEKHGGEFWLLEYRFAWHADPMAIALLERRGHIALRATPQFPVGWKAWELTRKGWTHLAAAQRL